MAAMEVLALAGAGCVATGTRPDVGPGQGQPRDLTPVSWLKAPSHAPVEIVREGQPRAVIYVADPRGKETFVDPRKKLAAESPGKIYNPQNYQVKIPSALPRLVYELGEVVRLSTGAALERVAQPPAADQPAIVIGDCEESRLAGIDASKIPVEGFVVKTARNRIFLVGSTQATPVAKANDGAAWAIADFLERFVGVRWYWPAEYAGCSIPRHASVVIPPMHYRDQPVSRLRSVYEYANPLHARSFDPTLLPMPGGVPEGELGVGATTHLPLWRYGNSWPYDTRQQGSYSHEVAAEAAKARPRNEALFAVNADGSRNYGVFCYSAPETMAYFLGQCEGFWDKKGRGYSGYITPSSVNIWAPIDVAGQSTGEACHCPACRAALARGGEAQVVGQFLKPFCQKVKERWPDKQVIFIPWNMKCFEETGFPDNLVIHYLQVPSLGLLQQPALRTAHDAQIRDWRSKAGHPISTWQSNQSPCDWTYGPVQYPHVAQDFFLKNRECVGGSFFVAYGAASFVTAAPTWYVITRSLWNPELDVDATLDEMCRRLFGPAAGTARELMRLECERWENTHLSRPLGMAEGRIPPRLFAELWPPDVVARMKALRDQALVKLAHDADARRAFLYWTWTFNAFLKDAEAIHGMAQAGAVVASGRTNESPLASIENADAAARFRGGAAETNNIRIVNIRRSDGATAGQSEVRFDLAWGNTWRAQWTEPAQRNVTGKDLPVESWSAAWVFVKYRLPGADGWSHATLSSSAADHEAPAATGGVAMTNDVGLTGDTGMGIFLYRAGAGHGPLDLQNVKLRWLHGVDGVTNPAAAAIKVFALEMVYVPRGAFALGTGPTGKEDGRFCEGASASNAFVVTEAWNQPVSDSPVTAARRIGNAPGRLWGLREGICESRPNNDRHGTLRFLGVNEAIGPEGVLTNGYPTGYEAFYCMRYELTQGQFTDFLNTISSNAFQSTFSGDFYHGMAHFSAAGRYALSGEWPNFTAAKSYQACNLLAWWDGAKYAAWAGLRPMTELEYEKACRGPLNPVPSEFAWGTTRIAYRPYTPTNEGQANERMAGNMDPTAGNASYDSTIPDFFGGPARVGILAAAGGPMRAGVFATPDSDRVAAGASYWGILELSGNVREQVVTVGHVRGRAFAGTHGTGTWSVPEDWPEANYSHLEGRRIRWTETLGSGLRGGYFNDIHPSLCASDRSLADFRVWERLEQNGWRGVRTAPANK